MVSEGDKVLINIPKVLPDWAQDPGLEVWRKTIADVNGKEGKVECHTGNGVLVSVGSSRFYGLTEWLKVLVKARCDCTVRDMWTFGHRCGRKAKVDRK